ncbi:transposase, partial [Neisseria meningitidis]|nr:transposase [Neisseria meningitidis]
MQQCPKCRIRESDLQNHSEHN